MDRLQKIIATIRKNLSGLGPTQKLLIGSLVVIMVMTLFLVSQYAGKPAYTELWPGSSAEDQVKAVAFLKTVGITAVNQSGKTMVPAAQHQQAVVALAAKGQQPSNSAVVFENLLKSQNWINSKEQNRQIYKVMLDNWLSGVISQFPEVDSAKVFVDAPEQVGFGASTKPAKASVTIFSNGNRGLDQAEVDAAARLVSGSVAGLELERVSLSVDGKLRRAMKDDDLGMGNNRAAALAVEKQFEEKLGNLLSYIDGVVVAVTATVDTSRSHGEVTKTLPIGEGSVSTPKKEMTSTTADTQATAAAQPGVRSNVGSDISTSNAGPGTKSTTNTEETESTQSWGTEHRVTETPAGTPTRLVATVAVPRGFVLNLIQKEQPAAAASGGAAPAATAPTAKEIQDRFDKERASIELALKPHFKTRANDGSDVQGEVVVMMVAGEGGSGAGAAKSGGGGAGGGGGGALGTMWALGGGMIDKVFLGALALVAIGMMVLMVRKTGKRVEMPTAEELVGLPPTLEAKSDVVGEADESETAMAGIEVGEEEIKSTKMRESVSEFIKQSPDAAGKLLNRWITVGE